ncbi:MAG: hypothetical protein ACLUJG_09655 [Lawsonibacter sp.]
MQAAARPNKERTLFMENSELEKQIDAWKEKVLSAHDGCGADTRKMMIDIDKIISAAFDHIPCFLENL